MTQQKGFQYRIYTTKKQEQAFSAAFGAARFVYNHFLEARSTAYKDEGKTVGKYECCRMLTALKQDSAHAWLKNADSMMLQESIFDLDKAFQAFFRSNAQYPRFKSRKHAEQSYRTRNQGNGIRIEGSKIRLPKIGWIKIKLSRDIPGRILNATVRRTATGKYFVSLCVEYELVPSSNAGGEIGIDMGIGNTFFTDQNGNRIDHPHAYASLEKKLAREQRKLSRKAPGSNNREKQRRKVAFVHEKIANTRKDFLHKTSRKLVNENQVIAAEALDVRQMLMGGKRYLTKRVADTGIADFLHMLQYKSFETGTDFVQVDKLFPSSELCGACGKVNPKLKELSVRRWTCPVCGARHDRDVNAAVNILREGKRLLAERSS